MITAEELSSYRADDELAAQTQQLVDRFAQMKEERQPFYLTTSDLDNVLRWKLRGQYGRGRALRGANSDRVLQEVSRLALNITHEDEEYELELRLHILAALRGVSLPIATAILAFAEPDRCGAIDYRSWRILFGQERRSFSIANYFQYLTQIRPLAAALKWSVLETDLALWAYDAVHNDAGD